MKELSIKEKARAYDEALEKARQLCDYPTSKPFISDLQDLFPELAESDGERIRKELIKETKGCEVRLFEAVTNDEFVAWLERQGEHANFRNKIQIGDKVTRNEDGVLVNLFQLKRVAKKDEKQGWQKSVEWSKEDEEMIIKICQNLHDYPHIKSPFDDESFNEALKEIQFIKSLKDRIQPKVEWSEEDEYYYNIIQYILNNECVGKTDKENAMSWFKSLRPHNRWKPSKDQIVALIWVLNNIPYCTHKEEISGLLEQLNKL